jgi:N,N'-diacetyllegionaminate synthase
MNDNHIHIIAEMACSHDGDEALARKIIDGAASGGADAIQFQIWKPLEVSVPAHPDIPLLERIGLSYDVWRALREHVRRNAPKLEVIACVYAPETVDFCETLDVDAYKLHAADLSNPRLVRRVAETGKRVDLSVGASTLDEIQRAIEWIGEGETARDVWLMYGYQLFPTPTNRLNLRYMMRLKELFGLRLGYQDHSDAESPAAFHIPAAAAGLGVDVLEKHLTHDRSKKGVDHQSALNPDEFARFVAMVREIETACGSAAPQPFSEEEKRYRVYSKKSVVAGREIAAGEAIAEGDLLFRRALAIGLPPAEAGRIVGRKAAPRIARYDLVREEDVR